MTAPADTASIEWAIRYPDGHREALHTAPGRPARLPAHAAERGAVLVRRTVGRWVEVSA